MCLNTDWPVCILDSKDLSSRPADLLVSWHGCIHHQAPFVAAIVIVEPHIHSLGAIAQAGEHCAVVVQVAEGTVIVSVPSGQVLQDGLQVTSRLTSDNSTIWWSWQRHSGSLSRHMHQGLRSAHGTLAHRPAQAALAVAGDSSMCANPGRPT